MTSNAIPLNAVSAVMGFDLAKANFNPSSPNLPQSICVYGEVNDANSGTFPTGWVQATNLNDVGNKYGYGSPLYLACRQIFQRGLTMPVYCYGDQSSGGEQSKIDVSIVGTATKSGSFKVRIAGRNSLDGYAYTVPVTSGDSADTVVSNMANVIAGALGCPIYAADHLGTGNYRFQSKWSGTSANDITFTTDFGGIDLGLIIGITIHAATGTQPSILTALTKIGNDWRPCIVNCLQMSTDSWSTIAQSFSDIETWVGKPDDTNPTGRYTPTLFKPSIVFTGATRDPRFATGWSDHANQVANCVAYAENSWGMPCEIAANWAAAVVNIWQNAPESDVNGVELTDIPGIFESDIPQSNNYAYREAMVAAGVSTSIYENGVYKINDSITTYCALTETPPAYRWTRDLNIFWNFKYAYRILEIQNLTNKAILPDGTKTNSPNTITPSQWKVSVSALMYDFELRGMAVNAKQNSKNIVVQIGGGSNPTRFDTIAPLQISSCGRVFATTVNGGFWYGN